MSKIDHVRFLVVEPIDSSKPSLRMLSDKLRSGNLGIYYWHYAYREHCAIQVAENMWGSQIYPLDKAFGITLDEADGIFCLLDMKLKIIRHFVTPDMVANEIDTVLAAQ